jgi:aspartate aminotransferase
VRLSSRARRISPSPTLAVDARAKELASAGERIINFGVGEPDFDTPQNIKNAAAEAMSRGQTKYTPVPGILELRKAICEKLLQDNGLQYRPEEIVVSCGAKHSLYNAIQVLVDEGDEVIIIAPYWVTYVEQIKLAGAKPVVIQARPDNGFKIKPGDILRALGPRTRLMILNSPSNPTGSVYTAAEIEALAEALTNTGIWILSDEIYEKLIYDGARHVSIAAVNPETQKKTVVVNGVSKAYAMTGWRIGYAAGPAEVAEAMAGLQSHCTSNPDSIAQAAALEALRGPQQSLLKMIAAFTERRNYILQRLAEIPGIKCDKPGGAFYVFPDVSAYFGRRFGRMTVSSGSDMAALLLEEAKVAVVPGAAFGDDRFVRISYATSFENIKEGMDRISKVLSF